MGALQNSYSKTMPIALKGQIYDNNPSETVVKAAEGVSGIKFGYGLVRGTNPDEQVKIPVATGTIVGLAVKKADAELVDGASEAIYKETEGVTILRRGWIYVKTEQAVVPGDPVFIRYTLAGATGTNPELGKARKDADTAKAVAFTGATFESTTAADGLALVRIA